MLFRSSKNSKALFMILALALIGAGFLLPVHQAKAFSLSDLCDYLPGCKTAQKAITFAGCVTDPVGCTQVLIVWWIMSMRTFVGLSIAYLAIALGWLITHLSNAPPTIIYNLWQFVRNFLNLFFILILIVIAFATIFDIKKYAYQQLLVRLVIIALLINFSHVIVTTVFDLGNQVSGWEINSMTAATGNSFDQLVQKIAGGPNLQNKLTDVDPSSLNTDLKANSQVLNTIGSFYSLVFSAIFNLIFLLIMAAAFAYATLAFLIRWPFIWLLTIVSPLAFFAFILPSTQKWFHKWWTEVISMAFSPVIFLLSLAMAVTIFSNAKSVEPPSVQDVKTPADVGLYLERLLALDDFVYLVVGAATLIGGIYASRKLGTMMGSTTVAWAGKAQNFIAYRATTLRPRVEGAKQGLIAVGEKYKEKGILGPGYLGAKRARGTEARYAEMFGATGAVAKQRQAEIDKAKEKYAFRNSTQLRQAFLNSPAEEQLAIREVLRERGELTAAEIVETYRQYVERVNTISAQKFAKNIDYGEFSSDERNNLFDAINDAETRRKIAKVRAEKGDYRTATSDELYGLSSLFVTQGEQKAFLDQVKKTNFENAIGALVQRGMIRVDGRVVTETAEAVSDEVRKMNMDAIMELSDRTLRNLITNPETGRLIYNKINKPFLDGMQAKFGEQKLRIVDNLARQRQAELQNQERQTRQEQAQAQAQALQPLVDALQQLVNRPNQNNPQNP